MGKYQDVYLQSDHWKKTRKQRVKRTRSQSRLRCERCGKWRKASEINVHHKHYESLWQEDGKDLEVLCRWCHAEHHQKIASILPNTDLNYSIFVSDGEMNDLRNDCIDTLAKLELNHG